VQEKKGITLSQDRHRKGIVDTQGRERPPFDGIGKGTGLGIQQEWTKLL
jgi:hypothetical protein